MTNGDDSEDDLEGLYDCSEIRSKGNFRAFVECDDETSWFYFCAVIEGKSKILSGHHILNGPLDFEQEDISVRWNNTESHVGFLIRDRLWAVYEAETGVYLVGRYRAGDNSSIPEAIVESFKPKH